MPAKQNGAFLKWGILAAVLLAFVCLVFYASVHGDRLRADKLEPPFIEAPSTAVKSRSMEPGGLDIPNQDKVVFDLLKDGSSSALDHASMVSAMPAEKPLEEFPAQAVEEEGHLNAAVAKADAVETDQQASEQPATPLKKRGFFTRLFFGDEAPPSVLKGQKSADNTALSEEESASALSREIQSAVNSSYSEADQESLKELAVQAISAPAPVAAVAQPAAKAKAEQKATDVWANRAAAEAQKTSSAPLDSSATKPSGPKLHGDWGVQLASFVTKADASNAQKIYTEKFGSQLGRLTPNVQEANIPGQGVRYRVRFLGLSTKEAAQDLCQTLKRLNQGCFPIRK